MKPTLFPFRFAFLVVVVNFLFLFSAICAQAEDIYIAQTAQGSDTGADCSNAHSAAWFNAAGNWGSGAGKISPGDTVHLCGTFTGTAGSSMLTMRGSGTSGNPITIKFEDGAILQAPYWGGNDGTNPTSGAITIPNSSGNKYLVIDGGTNGIIQNTLNGTPGERCLGGACSYGKLSCGIYIGWYAENIEIKNLTIRKMYVRTPYSDNGIQSGGAYGTHGAGRSNISIHHNNISDCAVCINVAYCGTSNWSIYNNVLSRAAIQIAMGNANVDCTLTNLSIHDNEMFDNYVYWDPDNNHHLNGMHIWAVASGSYIDGIEVYNNYVHGNFGHGTAPGNHGNHTTCWIFMEGGGGEGLRNGKYYNNLLVSDYAGDYPSTSYLGVYASPNVQIYNNTIVGSGPGIGIGVNSTNQIIKNNLIKSTDIYLSGANATFDSVDYNLYYGGDREFETGQQTYKTWAGWRALGWDAHGQKANPLLGATYRLQSSSPAKNAGTSLRSFFTTDKDGISRPQGPAWDTGAYEYTTAPPPPSPPSGLKIVP